MSISGISIKEMKAVVVGRSNIVGLPVSLLLIKMDATVTVVQSRTPDPESHIREADIGIVVTGQTMMVTSFFIFILCGMFDILNYGHLIFSFTVNS